MLTLGVTRAEDFLYACHIDTIVIKASRAAGGCRTERSRREIVPFLYEDLCGLYVRLILEYTNVIWSPINMVLENDIEIVQRRFTKRLPGLNLMTYDERLLRLGIDSLKTGRIWADLMLMVYN